MQEVAQEAIASSAESVRVADDSNAVAETGAAGLRKILAGIGDTVTLVSQIAAATSEQRTAGRSVGAAIAATAEQAKLIAASTAEQATAATAVVHSTGQMRKIAQEVTKAVSEQSRAARDVLKASQSTSKLAASVRQATAEQAGTVTQLTQAGESMRRGAATTARAVAEQSTAAGSDRQGRGRAVTPDRIGQQSDGRTGHRGDASSRRRPAACVRSRNRRPAPPSEQARAMREMTTAANTTARDVKLITQANRTQSATMAQLATQLADVRRVTERNAEGVKQTRGGTAALLKHAEALTGLMGEALTHTPRNGNGRGR